MAGSVDNSLAASSESEVLLVQGGVILVLTFFIVPRFGRAL